MSYETLIVESAGPIATLTLNRPRVLNALNAQLFAELDHALDALVSDPAVRVLLLTGAGEKAFAAGADIQELALASALEGQAIARRGQQLFSRLETCGKPVIACINGFALGGGCELAMSASFRIASDNAKFGQPEVKLGLIPGYGGSQRLPRLIGRGRALKLLLTGEIITAQQALELGLVEEIVPPAGLIPRAHELAQIIASIAPIALRETLHTVHTGLDLPLDAALALEAAAFGVCCGTADKNEGTAAFLEKRTARWTGA